MAFENQRTALLHKSLPGSWGWSQKSIFESKKEPVRKQQTSNAMGGKKKKTYHEKLIQEEYHKLEKDKNKN